MKLPIATPILLGMVILTMGGCMLTHGSVSSSKLVKNLNSPDPDERADTARMIGWLIQAESIKEDVVKPALIQALNDPDPDVRMAVIMALSQMGENAAEALPIIAKEFGDSNSAQGVVIGEVIPRFGTPAVPYLIDELDNENSDIRFVASSGLVELGLDTEEALLEVLQTKKGVSQYMAAYTLTALQGPNANHGYSILIELVDDQTANIRFIAMKGITALGTEALPLLCASLQSEEVSIRKNAATMLGMFAKEAGEDALHSLLAALEDSELVVQLAAIRSLGSYVKFKDWVIPPLVVALGRGNGKLAMEAAAALEEIGESCIQYLITALDAKNTDLRRESAYTLGRFGAGAEPAIPALIRALKDSMADVRYWSCVSLGKIGIKTETLVQNLKQVGKSDSSPKVRSAAEKALERLKTVVVDK